MFPRISLRGKLAISAVSSASVGVLLIVEDLIQYVEFIKWPWSAEIGGLLTLSEFFPRVSRNQRQEPRVAC